MELPDMSTNRFKRSFPTFSFTHSSPLKRSVAQISNHSIHNAEIIDETYPLVRAHEQHNHVPLHPQLTVAHTSIAQHHQPQISADTETCNPSLDTCIYNHGSYPNHEPCLPCTCEDPLKLYAQSLVQAVSHTVTSWTWKRMPGPQTESAGIPCSDRTQSFDHAKHPAPWLISTHWVSTLLMACAKSISMEDKESTYHLMCVLSSLTSRKDASLDCRLASYFVHALRCKVNGTGRALQKDICTALGNLKLHLGNAMKMLLVWREVTPWCAFGQDAANGALLEALKNENKLHVVDVSHWACLCMQWPTLVEALATRPEGAPHLRLTVVIMWRQIGLREAMKATGKRITRFAHLMGLPSFTFKVLYEPALEKLDACLLDVRLGEALAINLNQTLQYLPTRASKHGGESPRDMTLKMLQKCNPKVMVLVENEVDQVSSNFSDRFCNFYRFVSAYLGSMDRPDMAANQARLRIQEEAAKIMIINNVACDNNDERGDAEEFRHECPEAFSKREQIVEWAQRLNNAGFRSTRLGDNVLRRVEMLLGMYPSHWGLLRDVQRWNEARGAHEHSPNSLTLTWGGYPIHTFTVWSVFQ